MDQWLDVIVAVICSVMASGGFWAYFQKRTDRNSAANAMLIGLGHDRIMYLAMCYVDRGWVTSDEYENLYQYLYVPYKKMGGNGSADRVMKEVDKLPIRKDVTGSVRSCGIPIKDV